MAVTCKSFNNNNHLIAVGLGESESSDVLNSLLRLCMLAGVDLNSDIVVFVSDRGVAIIKAVTCVQHGASFTLVSKLHMSCINYICHITIS